MRSLEKLGHLNPQHTEQIDRLNDELMIYVILVTISACVIFFAQWSLPKKRQISNAPRANQQTGPIRFYLNLVHCFPLCYIVFLHHSGTEVAVENLFL